MIFFNFKSDNFKRISYCIVRARGSFVCDAANYAFADHTLEPVKSNRSFLTPAEPTDPSHHLRHSAARRWRQRVRARSARQFAASAAAAASSAPTSQSETADGRDRESADRGAIERRISGQRGASAHRLGGAQQQRCPAAGLVRPVDR